MDNSESVTGSSVENPKGLHEGDGELHQADQNLSKAGAMEGTPLKNRARTAKNDDRKEVGPCKSWNLYYDFIKACYGTAYQEEKVKDKRRGRGVRHREEAGTCRDIAKGQLKDNLNLTEISHENKDFGVTLELQKPEKPARLVESGLSPVHAEHYGFRLTLPGALVLGCISGTCTSQAEHRQRFSSELPTSLPSVLQILPKMHLGLSVSKDINVQGQH